MQDADPDKKTIEADLAAAKKAREKAREIQK